MNERSITKTAKRARLAAVILTAAIALPGVAVADHTECVPGSTSDACGAFDPQFLAGAQVPFTDTPSSVTLRFNQKDTPTHDYPALGMTYLVPKGWQFALNTLRPAQVSEPGHTGKAIGDPATDCSQVILGEENDADDDSARLGRAENLAGGVGSTGNIEWTRDNSIAPLKFGYRRNSASEFNGDITNQFPSLSFLSWDGTTAKMCLYLYANTQHVAEEFPQDTDCLTFCLISAENEAAREHIVPVTMTKVATGELLNGEDISLKFGWKVEYDLTSFYGNPFLYEQQLSLLDSLFYIDAISGGNWNTNPVTDKPEQIVFSKTPKAAGTYEFRGIFTTCREGLATPPAPPTTTPPTDGSLFAEQLAVKDLCANTDDNPANDLMSTTRSVFQKILAPPDSIVYDFAKLTGPKGSLAGVSGMNNFGLVRGTNEATFTWNQPPVAATEKLKGYLLTVAVPGQQETRHFEYIITNKDDAGFDAREVCGPNGDAASCSVKLTFPLSTIGPNALGPNGKYNVSLITLYEGSGTDMDFRSDGLCDDGIGFGVDCPSTQPAFRITGTGISTWQLLMRSDAWPLAYVHTESVTRTGGGPTYTAPRYVLLTDFEKKRGEFVVWNAVDGPADVYAASTVSMIGDNTEGGVASFFSAAMVGHAKQFRFDGVLRSADARGMFALYDLKGLPGAVPPGGMPSAFTRIFTGSKI